MSLLFSAEGQAAFINEQTPCVLSVLNRAAVSEDALIYDAQQAMREGGAFLMTYVGWENILADIGHAYPGQICGRRDGGDGEYRVRTALALSAVLLILMVLAVAAVLRQRSSERMVLQEQANPWRQEELNVRLAESKEAAEQALKIAEEANRAKSSFLSNMSHDIRTPMNAVIGFSTLLARDAENPEKVREYTKKITSSSQHLLGLINDILDISKIEAGKTKLNLADVDIVDLTEGIDGIIRPQMTAKSRVFIRLIHDRKRQVSEKWNLHETTYQHFCLKATGRITRPVALDQCALI